LELEQLEGRVVPSTITIGASKDNTLYSQSGDLSNGAGGAIFVGEVGTMGQDALRRGVIAFDIADNIPAGSTINSVTLTLHLSQAAAGQNVELHKLSADWGEGTSNGGGMGTQATTNDATWTYEFYNTVTWHNQGGDFASTASATTFVPSSAVSPTWSSSQMVADVQNWLDNPSSDFGWLLRGDETQPQHAQSFDSSKNSTTTNRPTLTIDYTSATTTASTLQVAGFPSPETAGMTGTETVTAKDSSGMTVTGYTGTVHLTSSDPAAVFVDPATGQPVPGNNYTFTAADAGMHSFTVTLTTAGSQSITATDTGTTSITGSQSGITVNPAAADHFNVSTPAGSVTAGTPFDLVVTAQDAYNNTVTGYTGTVTFTTSDPGGTVPVDYTFTPSDNGVHTFPLGATLVLAGSQTISATDTTTTSITGAGTFDVSAAALDHFSITTPGPVAAGVAFDLIVTAQDRYGNTVTGYTGTVTFTTSDPDPQVSLPPDYPFVGADNGMHTFPNGATLYSTGNQTIFVTDLSDNTITGSLTVTL
jgi:hypothetical protein